MIQPTYHTVLPAQVRFDSSLSAGVKIFYGEVLAYCHQQGYCPVDKPYFADLFKVSTKTVTNWIIQL